MKTEKFIEIIKEKKQRFFQSCKFNYFHEYYIRNFFFNKMRKCQQQKSINSDLTKIEFWSSFKKSNQ